MTSQQFYGQMSKLYDTNNRLNVIELLTTIKTYRKQTKNTSKIIDLRGPPETPKHRGAVFTTGGKPSTWFPPEGLVEQKLKIFERNIMKGKMRPDTQISTKMHIIKFRRKLFFYISVKITINNEKQKQKRDKDKEKRSRYKTEIKKEIEVEDRD